MNQDGKSIFVGASPAKKRNLDFGSCSIPVAIGFYFALHTDKPCGTYAAHLVVSNFGPLPPMPVAAHFVGASSSLSLSFAVHGPGKQTS